MAACWLLAPAPTRSPLSWAESLLPASAVPPPSLAAPRAESARVPASATDTVVARVLVLSFNSVPLDSCPDEFPGSSGTERGR